MRTWSPTMRDQLNANGSVANQYMEYLKIEANSSQLFSNAFSNSEPADSPVDDFTAG
jgi:hypothetical protein